jgi:hypothetical protein
MSCLSAKYALAPFTAGAILGFKTLTPFPGVLKSLREEGGRPGGRAQENPAQVGRAQVRKGRVALWYTMK